jgi:putative Mn2+ efflux pump MntP
VAFWTGLITFGFALSFLFNILWSAFAFTWGIGIRAFSDLYVVGSIVFLFIGLYMMIKGIKDWQAPAYKENQTKTQRPLGVTTVAVLTFLSSGALLVLCLMYLVPFSYFYGLYLPGLIAFFLSVFGFFLSISMFNDRTRYIWYASIVFWPAFLAFFVWLYTNSGIWHYVFYLEGPLSTFYGALSVVRILAMPSPLVCAAICLTYLLTKAPRRYFS